MALQVGQTGDAYHIYPLFASGGGSFFGTTANGDPDPKNVTVDSAESIAAGEQDRGARREGRQGPQDVDRRHERDPAVLRQEGAVPGLRPVGGRRHQEGRHQLRHQRRSRLRGRQAGRAVHRRQRLLPRQQGQEQGAGPGVRHELPDDAGLSRSRSTRPSRAAGADRRRSTRSRRPIRTSPSSRPPARAARSCRRSRRWARSGGRSATPRRRSSGATTSARRSTAAAKAIRDGIAKQ